MNAKIAGCVVGLLLATWGLAQAGDPEPLPGFEVALDGEAGGKEQPKQPDKDKKLTDKDKKLTEPPKTDLFTAAPLMGPQFPTAFSPHMMGDFSGGFVRQTFTVIGLQTTTMTTFIIKNPAGLGPVAVTTTTITPVTQTRTIVVPAGSSTGAFKIAENESPRPTDRVFFTYNYFNNLQGLSSPPNDTSSSGQTTVVPTRIGGTVTATSVTFPATPRVTANLNREVFGFEKTFLDGNASFELRMPLLQQNTNVNGFDASNVGDLTVIGKYAFINDRDTGNVFSIGLAITAPTGPSIDTIDGPLHSTLLQPWVGYIWNTDRFFVQAFHAVVVPTDARDVTMLFNDVGLNYWLYRGEGERRIRFVVPMAEFHVTTPLNHRDLDNAAIFVPDLVVFTGGVHIGLPSNATISMGVATPLSGPRVYSTEAFLQLNWRF